MKSTILAALRSVGAVVAGFAVITLGTVFTFTVLVDGINYHESTVAELAIGTLGALASGLAGGFVAARLAARHPLRHAGALAIPIALDTASILSSGTGSNPWWFDLGGSATLLLGALVGGYQVKTRLTSRRAAAGPASAPEHPPRSAAADR